MVTYRPLHAGKLRHRVRIQQPIETQDPENGEMIFEWGEYASRWADYVPSSVRDFIAAGEFKSQVSGRFVLRTDPGLTPQMRIIHRGRVYAILGLMEDPDSGLEYITAPVSQGTVFDGR